MLYRRTFARHPQLWPQYSAHRCFFPENAGRAPVGWLDKTGGFALPSMAKGGGVAAGREGSGILDACNTSAELAASGTELAILPIGATEQHGSYLPLATDSLEAEAEAVARGVAERLDAFLLPVLPFSNSEAHAGFRGSVSLNPSTLLIVVKELALDLIGQGFRYVVLLNMHGGNLILRPAVREINRSTDAGRALFVQPFTLAAAELQSIFPNFANEAHAGGFEASLIMEIAPDTIKVAGQVLGGSPAARGVSYFSDASVLTPALGVPTLIFGPGDERLAHQVDEHTTLSSVAAAARFYTALAQALG